MHLTMNLSVGKGKGKYAFKPKDAGVRVGQLVKGNRMAGRHARHVQPLRAIQPWERMQPLLYGMIKEGKMVTYSPLDVSEMMAQDSCVVIDVRLQDDFTKVHASKAISIPLFQPISTWSVTSVLKKAFYSLNGISGVEENPTFTEEVVAVGKQAADDNKMVLFMCDAGGTAEAVPGFLLGKQSRSLQAIYKAIEEAKLERVGHVEGGLRMWAGVAQLELAGEDKEAWRDKASALPY